MIRFCLQVLLIINCLCFFNIAGAQKLTYKIVFNKEDIGNLIAERDAQKENVHYILKSKMTVDKIVNVEIDYRLESDFKNGKMTHSSAYQKVNSRVQVSSSTQWDGSTYNIQTIDMSTILRNKAITFNMCALYFNEPVNLKEVYSDALGKFLRIRQAGKHRYELILPDGKKNYYNYASGICFQVETEQLFSKIIFLLTH